MSSQVFKAGFIALAFVGQASAVFKYTLDSTDNYSGANFYNFWNFTSDDDPTHGFVDYKTEDQAVQSSLISYDPVHDQSYMGVDYTNSYVVGVDRGRPSVRLESKKVYQYGLFVGDFAHMPASVCGTWPSFWTVHKDDYPTWGEIDIVENINEQTVNLETLHTTNGFNVTANHFTYQQTGVETSYNCDNNAWSGPFGTSQFPNQGCSAVNSDPNSYGSTFNAVGGGVYVMEWTSEFIKIWNFDAGSVPDDITKGNPDPSSWSVLPSFTTEGSPGKVDDYFANHQVILDTTFCGDYAGLWNFWEATSCYDSDKYPTCNDYVAANPSVYEHAYWLINSIKIYQWTDTPDTTSSTQTTSTTSQTSTSSTESSTSSTSTTTTTSSSSATTSSSSSSGTSGSVPTSSYSSGTSGSITYSSSETSAPYGNSTSTSSSYSSGASGSVPTSSYSSGVSGSITYSSSGSSAPYGNSSSTSSTYSSGASGSIPTSSFSSGPSSSVSSSSYTSGSSSAPYGNYSSTYTPSTTATSTTATEETSTPSPTPTSSLSSTSYTVSTVVTTKVIVVTSCAPEVTNCPNRPYLTTVTIPLYTTICPVTETEAPGGGVASLTSLSTISPATETATPLSFSYHSYSTVGSPAAISSPAAGVASTVIVSPSPGIPGNNATAPVGTAAPSGSVKPTGVGPKPIESSYYTAGAGHLKVSGLLVFGLVGFVFLM